MEESKTELWISGGITAHWAKKGLLAPLPRHCGGASLTATWGKQASHWGHATPVELLTYRPEPGSEQGEQGGGISTCLSESTPLQGLEVGKAAPPLEVALGALARLAHAAPCRNKAGDGFCCRPIKRHQTPPNYQIVGVREDCQFGELSPKWEKWEPLKPLDQFLLPVPISITATSAGPKVVRSSKHLAPPPCFLSAAVRLADDGMKFLSALQRGDVLGWKTRRLIEGGLFLSLPVMPSEILRLWDEGQGKNRVRLEVALLNREHLLGQEDAATPVGKGYPGGWSYAPKPGAARAVVAGIEAAEMA
ncbi:hypothetical protein EYF80_000771 [Liparis tanakae]|uniref:Uncharacterized protein n=1 Tax=Liparis tanakae TaxID=230148 RepID=A0A4Z2JGB7_9TELE|nr:hypothetical protein EYF80_000771 [Liparis tanakae]